MLRAVRTTLAGANPGAAPGKTSGGIIVAVAVAVALSLAGPAAAAGQPSKAAPAKPSTPGAGAAERIAAVVNDDVISVSDVSARMRLVLTSTGLSDNQESRQRVMSQVLRSLIDERLQLQEARRLNISVSEDEVEAGLKQIAEQNRLPRNQLEKFLAERAIPLSTLVVQVRSSIAWSKLIQRRLRPTVQIGEDEIDAAIERIKANAGKPEYLVAEIFLAVDKPEQDEDVRRLADRLIDQIRQSGNFPAVARQFSQGAGATNGGDIGWIQQGQLMEELDSALRQMRPGTLTRPIRSPSGYHILLVRDQRAVAGGGGSAPANPAPAPARPAPVKAAPAKPAPFNPGQAKVSLKQLILPYGDAGSPAAVKARAAELSRTVKTCATMDAKIKEFGGSISGDLGTVRVVDLPPQLGRLVLDMPIGHASPPLLSDKGAMLLTVCARSGVPPKPKVIPEPPAPSVEPPSPSVEPPRPPAGPVSLPGREDILNALGRERLDMLQRRLMRDLRRAAFVEMRG